MGEENSPNLVTLPAVANFGQNSFYHRQSNVWTEFNSKTGMNMFNK
jgi:hypothetical protein